MITFNASKTKYEEKEMIISNKNQQSQAKLSKYTSQLNALD